MANLDLTYYHGEDHYSDGDETENRLLEIVRSGQILDDLPMEEVSWPVLYHLHPVRENICNWYPFRKGSRVLEIGSGCGAVTGALCQSGCEVWSVELSKRRATINYERNKDYDCLHIMVGNLNEMNFDAPFDYVVLIGVLEYAGKYTEGSDPWKTFLNNIRNYLKADGKLLVAIENLLGLKYFAGANEDHLGKPFAGLSGYKPTAGVRTFSKRELKELLKNSGFSYVNFFYPYPDYKFPLEIYSEKGMERFRYGKEYYPVDEPRFALFPENHVNRIMIREGIGGKFANSFLAEASVSDANADEEESIVYVKPNNDRSKAFRVGTKIRRAEGNSLEALKYARSEQAREHLQKIQANEELMGQYMPVLMGKETPEGLAYPIISDPSADEKLTDLLNAKDKEGILKLFDDIHQMMEIHPEEAEYHSSQFTRWFGDAETAQKAMLCVQPANIDMILDNLFIRDESYIVLDCEWVVDFPVPLAFVMWRVLVSALHYHPDLEQIPGRKELMHRYHISAEDENAFSAWSEYFEKNYVGNRSLSRFSKGTRMVTLDQKKMDWLEARVEQLEAELQSFYDSFTCKAIRKLRRTLLPGKNRQR